MFQMRRVRSEPELWLLHYLWKNSGVLYGSCFEERGKSRDLLKTVYFKQFRSRFLGRKCIYLPTPRLSTSPAGHRPHRGPLGSLRFRWGHDWYDTPS